MTYKYTTFFRWLTIGSDYAILNLALFISFMLESHVGFWDASAEQYRLHFLLVNLFWYFCSTRVKLYENILIRDAVPTGMSAITALMLFLAGPLVLSVGFPRFSLSTDFIVQTFLIYAVPLLASKIAFLFVRRSRRQFWLADEKVVIIGSGPAAKDLYRYLNAHFRLGYRVEGVFDDQATTENMDEVPLLGGVQDCFDYAVANGISKVFCALPSHEMDKAKPLMEQADKYMLRLRLVPDLKGYMDANVMMELFGHMPVISPRMEPLENKANEVIKRAFDVVFSSFVILFLLSWLIPLIALVIKLDSRGPVFFQQLRSGKGNKPFYCYKFRSMTVNVESDQRQASKNDNRITRVGAILRKTSLDELPQFFNVLMGDMSVVGPRPHMLKHTEDYSMQINNFMVRHFLTPGITGWAQVKGFRGETKETESMSKRVEADLWYLSNWSFLLDVKIIFLTVWQAIRGNENAY